MTCSTGSPTTPPAAAKPTAPQHERELKIVDADIAKADQAIERYLLAFEAGTLPDTQCGPRIRDLGQLADARQHIRDAIETGDEKHRNHLLQAVIAEIRVDSREHITPVYRVPHAQQVDTVRAPETLVDLVRAYSNPSDASDQVKHLRSLLDLPRAVRRERHQRPRKQTQTRLDPEEVAKLVAAYQAGGRVKQLASQFSIHRLTVTSILQREGVTLRPRGIHPDDLPKVIRLYEDGWALARLAIKFDVSPSTVTNTLRRAGVPSGERSARRPGCREVPTRSMLHPRYRGGGSTA